MENSALVVGVNPEVENIGAAINRRLSSVMRCAGLDIYGPDDIPIIIEFLSGEWNNLIVSCGMTCMAPFEEQRDIDLYRVVEANLITPMIIARRFVGANIDLRPNSSESQVANIVFIGSYAHNHVLSNSAAYCAAKAGLHMLGKCLAWELTGKGFNIFVVHPHSVQNTPMTHEVIDALMEQKDLDTAEALEYWNRTKLLPERLTTSEVADVVANLIFTGTRHISGAAIELYGGER